MTKLIVRVLAVACLLSFASGSAFAAAGAAIGSASARASKAEYAFRDCGKKPPKDVVDCIARETGNFAGSIGGCTYISSVAPSAPATAGTAARAIAGAKTKEAALAILNRASSVLRGLAAKSSGETRDVYNRVDRAFQTAISVLRSKS